ncbi:MAG: response regulator [Anaerolineae bacterium]|nr:response regulator [Anaerolineae bacterium]
MTQEAHEFNVLVVDDDEDVGYLFERLLGGPQEVTIAADGFDALEKAKAKKFDLIFLDVRLPGIDGVETLKQLKEVAPDAIAIMMSGYEDVKEKVKQAFALGAQDFLEKPFRDVSEIMTIEQVARYLSLHELTVRRLARDGEIPAFKVGRQWRVKRELLDSWIEREAYRNLGE